jgi:hypothetical protein
MWTPNAVRRLLALIAGVGLLVFGGWLIVNGISATGSLDIQSAFVSGKIQSGSAGLFMTFLATFIIIFATFGTDHSPRSGAASRQAANRPNPFFVSSTARRILWILCIVLFLTFVAAVAVPAVQSQAHLTGVLTGIMLVTGFAAFFLFAALLIEIIFNASGESE